MNEINLAPVPLTTEQLKRIFDLMPDLVYVLNLDAQSIHYTNARLLDVLGYTFDDVAEMGYTLGPVMVHDDLNALAVQLSAEFDNLSEDKTSEFVISFKHKNGQIKTLRNRASVMTRHPDGRNHLVVVVAEDITKTLVREKTIQQQQYQLSEAEKIFEYGSWEWDCSKDYIRWSAGMFKLIGLSDINITHADVPRDLYDTFVMPQDSAHVWSLFEAVVAQQNEGYEVAHRLIDLQENVKHVLIKTKLSYDQNGNLTQVVGVIADVTQLENYKRELERQVKDLNKSNAELEQFAYVASHDLQEPLRKIISFGERLERRYAEKLGDEGRFFVERMTNAAQRMHVLIDDLLAYSRVSRHDESFQKLRLNNIVSQILNDLELRIQQKKAVVVVEKLPNITAQPTQIYQLFQNLLTNALKFTRPDVTPQITIKSRLATPDELQEVLGSATALPYHRISVSDNGIGFDNEYAEQIFVLFQRLHGRAEYEGTGLGLAICRKIVERHHGHIAARGQLGAGAEFVVYLPETQNPNN